VPPVWCWDRIDRIDPIANAATSITVVNPVISVNKVIISQRPRKRLIQQRLLQRRQRRQLVFVNAGQAAGRGEKKISMVKAFDFCL
jgi:hypothetical protein